MDSLRFKILFSIIFVLELTVAVKTLFQIDVSDVDFQIGN